MITFSILSLISRVSSISCCSFRSTFRIEATKSAILPGWSMLTMLRRISSEKRGLFSDICFISERIAWVRAFILLPLSIFSSRYSTSAAIGTWRVIGVRILNRLRVEMNMFIPPSGRLIFLTILATVPTEYRSSIEAGPSSSVPSSLSIVRPRMPPLLVNAFSTVAIS